MPNRWHPHEAKAMLKLAQANAKRSGSGLSPDMLYAITQFVEATELVPYLEHELLVQATHMEASGLTGYPQTLKAIAEKLGKLIARKG